MSAVGTAVAFAVVLAFLAAPLYGFAAILHSAYNALRGQPGGRGASSGIDSDSAGSV
jgi:hypothetical protein